MQGIRPDGRRQVQSKMNASIFAATLFALMAYGEHRYHACALQGRRPRDDRRACRRDRYEFRDGSDSREALDPVLSTPDELASLLRREIAKYANVINVAGIELKQRCACSRRMDWAQKTRRLR
jgi:hypothetical protein